LLLALPKENGALKKPGTPKMETPIRFPSEASNRFLTGTGQVLLPRRSYGA
jgi:hypothetical protein